MTGRDAILDAFDRLFAAAATKLDVKLTPQERADAKEAFSERFSAVLEMTNRFESPAFPPEVMTAMEAQIERISPTELAGLVASVPLAQQAQEMMRAAAIQHAQQKMLEHLALQADTRYGGN
jgi:hypothetical protein